MNHNMWLDGIMGVIVGDALGCPVQFMSRKEIEKNPVVEMNGYGTYNMPPGTWTDDGSMTLATLDSIKKVNKINLIDIMKNFVNWYEYGAYTQYGEAFDIGNTCSIAIEKYIHDKNINTCGETGVRSNGNGSLMRIMPACLYAIENHLDIDKSIQIVHDVSGLTHNHLRSKIACGLYYFCVYEILKNSGNLCDIIQNGIYNGLSYYRKNPYNRVDLSYYSRLYDIHDFSKTKIEEIYSGGYVVHTLEAAIWSLINTNSFKECLLKAVNLGDDTDTVAAIVGGLAGLYYGYNNIPEEWLEVIKKRQWIEKMCKR